MGRSRTTKTRRTPVRTPAAPQVRAGGRLVPVRMIDVEPTRAKPALAEARTLVRDMLPAVLAHVVTKMFPLYQASWAPDAEDIADGAVLARSARRSARG